MGSICPQCDRFQSNPIALQDRRSDWVEKISAIASLSLFPALF
ncbi:hypothetical protein [Planktothricoides sp. SR001]|nr:hypothetical protein [Planktothricoides sp. SR001]